MNHELDKLGNWKCILEQLAKIEPDVIAGDATIAPCQWVIEHESKTHSDCQIFEWLGYSVNNRPSIEEYTRISKIIQAYLTRFEPNTIPWNFIKELVADGKD